MTDPAVSVPRMAVISARYTQTVTVFPHPGGPDAVSILPRDPQRYFINIQLPPGPAANVYVFTGQPGFTGGAGVVTNLPMERKWHDDPAGVTEEWFAIVSAPTDIVITTTRYIGD